MLIRDLEEKTGLDRATIRFYEKEGLISPERKDNGYREYSDENLSHLLKIKLLRQLGMSLETIKGLQKGTEDFDTALSIRIQALEQQARDADKAKEVCAVLRNAQVQYDTLNAEHYLSLLNHDMLTKPAHTFCEDVMRPYHPGRRFFARLTDYVLLQTILELLFVVVFRIRPFGKFLSLLIRYGTPFLVVILSAIMLKYCGTTPGKWLYGLSVRSENGNLLSYNTAYNRESGVLKWGCGFGLPIYREIRLIKSWVSYKRDEDLDWDMYSEYHYSDWKRRNTTLVVAMIWAIIAANFLLIQQQLKPKYIGELTVAEFSDNYNYIASDLFDSGRHMNEDGTWEAEQPNSVAVYIDGQSKVKNQNFVFNTDANHNIHSIRYENSWTEIFYMVPASGQCKYAAITALMSQKGTGVVDLYRFTKELDDADFLLDGKIEFENIEIIWDVDAVNCIAVNNSYFVAKNKNKPSRVDIVFDIIIHDK